MERTILAEYERELHKGATPRPTGTDPHDD
jgi:hypothetical protein